MHIVKSCIFSLDVKVKNGRTREPVLRVYVVSVFWLQITFSTLGS